MIKQSAHSQQDAGRLLRDLGLCREGTKTSLIAFLNASASTIHILLSCPNISCFLRFILASADTGS